MTQAARVKRMLGAFGPVDGYEDGSGLVSVTVRGITQRLTEAQFRRRFGDRARLNRYHAVYSVEIADESGELLYTHDVRTGKVWERGSNDTQDASQ